MLLEHNLVKEVFLKIRKTTEELCKPLTPEDHVVQPVMDVSPPKWHLAHTTWFFEAFILQPFLKGYSAYNEKYGYLFNSYYESAGSRVLREERGNMTRPTVEEVLDYRAYVDLQMVHLLEQEDRQNEFMDLLELGLNHEQQHQELLLYDAKYILGHNPLFPFYSKKPGRSKETSPEVFQEPKMLQVESGIYNIGHEGTGFCFDNELARHRVFVESYGIMDRLITNGEYLEFINAGGYKDFRFWLSEGWDWIKKNNIACPMYWHFSDGKWYQYSLNGGLKELEMSDPVAHVSFFEADAFGKWKGLRLPTEFEWEIACQLYAKDENANFMESGLFEPISKTADNNQFFGDVWEWTNSAYLPYPSYKHAEGAVGEYNGKFMINQMVLRGGSCATSRDHIRTTYRNFFHPHLRWMFSGIRLAVAL